MSVIAVLSMTVAMYTRARFHITREKAVLVTSTSLDWPRVLLALTILLLALGWLLTYLWWRRRPIP